MNFNFADDTAVVFSFLHEKSSDIFKDLYYMIIAFVFRVIQENQIIKNLLTDFLKPFFVIIFFSWTNIRSQIPFWR